MAISRAGGSGQPVPPVASSSNAAWVKRLLLTTAVADLGALAVEVFDAAAGEHQVGVRLKLAAHATFALLGGSVALELIFEGKDDHAHRGDRLAHDDHAGHVEVESGIVVRPKWKNCRKESDQARKPRHAEEDAGGKTAEDKDEQDRGQCRLTQTTKIRLVSGPSSSRPR